MAQVAVGTQSFTFIMHSKGKLGTLACTYTQVAHKHKRRAYACHQKSHKKAPKQACCQVYPNSTTRVQSSIDSRNSAIHKGYHTSLRPSSLSEPRHPSLKVVIESNSGHNTHQVNTNNSTDKQQQDQGNTTRPQFAALEIPHERSTQCTTPAQNLTFILQVKPCGCVRMILPQVHLRKPCYDFSFL